MSWTSSFQIRQTIWAIWSTKNLEPACFGSLKGNRYGSNHCLLFTKCLVNVVSWPQGGCYFHSFWSQKQNKSVESLGYKGMLSGAEKNYPHLCYHGWLSHLILILQSETYYKPFWGWLPKITIIHGSDIILPILLGGELPRNRQRIVTLVLTGPAPYLTLLGWTNPLTSSMSQYIPLNPIKSQLDFGDQT